MKKNIKAFALVETLVVTVFIMTIFTLLFTTLYPLASEYEKVSNYDDIDTKYIAHYIRKNIVTYGNDSAYTLSNCHGTCHIFPGLFQNDDSCDIDFNTNDDSRGVDFCKKYYLIGNVEHIYLTKYNLTNFKNEVNNDNNNTYSRGLKEYVNSLTNFDNPLSDIKVNDPSYYRIIVEVNRSRNANGLTYSYATIEVKKP